MTEVVEEKEIRDEEDLEVNEDEGVSEIEEEAAKHGWNPEGVDGKRNLSAEEFMDRQTLYDDIRKLKRKNNQLQEGFEALKGHHEKVAQLEREKVINQLKQAKVRALQEDEHEKVVEIDDRIADVKAEAVAAVKADDVVNDAFNEWIDDNPWYNQDPEMRTWADSIGLGYAKQTGAGPADVYEYVAKEVRARFADKFGTPGRRKASPVEGANKGSRANNTSAKLSAKDLNEEERRVMKNIVRSGAMTEKQYLAEYAEIR